jgi:thiamine pyrophosphate-dependent acetolactate synthase large subunit-like protein
MKKSDKNVKSLDRRRFLQGAAAGTVATLVAGRKAVAKPQAAAPQRATAPVLAAETDPRGAVEVLTLERPGSDFMVDVLKSLVFEYIASNPGSSFRSLHESFVNYGKNKSPEFLTCTHEESSVAMAHGYAQVEGKPMMVMAHSTVGLQHAAMGIYNAYAGRSPVFIVLGNTIDETERRPGVEWYHSAQDAAAMVREFTKWDDTPISLQHFAESAVRAYKISTTLPMMPVVVVADSTLQENPIPSGEPLHIPKLTLDAQPAGDSASVAEAAKMLVAAENPVIIAGRVARSDAGMARMVELAEALQAPVIDEGGNMPNRHPLNQMGGRGLLRTADVILSLEVSDLYGTLNTVRDQQVRSSNPNIKAGAKVINVHTGELFLHSNYQDFQRLQEVDLEMAADPETTLPSLTEAVKKLTTADRKQAFADRGKKLADNNSKAWDRARNEAVYGWDASPISTTRLSSELWGAVRNEDWALVGGGGNFLWNFTKYSHRMHGGSAAGVGYSSPAAVGAALAHRKYGRVCIHVQNDGDLMYAPGVLWTAAHHKIPFLALMHNNRAYHQEVMHIQRMADRHNRGITNAGIGTTIVDPNIDYATLAKSMGVEGIGPITDPAKLGPALKQAVEIVKSGRPVLVDAVTQPR